jgi:geranylgeranyl diphosphate synthase, type II
MQTAGYLLNYINESIDKEDFNRKPVELYEPISYILSLGGKRIRPVMMLMTVDMYDGNLRKAMPAALGLEIFHNFSLVHDDIMDRAPIRRGKPTVHEKWNPNIAILSGDTMLVKAYEQFLKLPESLIRQALEIFSDTAKGVCEGQQLDMNFESRNDVSIPEYLEMIRLKTAVLIGAAFRLGSLLAGAPPEDQQLLYDFGINTGLLFQLRDDLLDAYGDEKEFGKKQYGDIVANKKTYLYLKALELSSEENKTKLIGIFSDNSVNQDDKIKLVLDCFDAAKARKHTEAKIEEYYNLAVKAFNSLTIDDERKAPLRNYTAKLMGRNN